MNMSNQETKLLVIVVMIAAVAGLAAQSLTTQTAEAYSPHSEDCRTEIDGTLICSGGVSGSGECEGCGEGPGGHGGAFFVNPETGDAVQAGGGSRDSGQPSQDNQKEGSGGRCEYNFNEEGADCVGGGS
jgi:hypothetical protein